MVHSKVHSKMRSDSIKNFVQDTTVQSGTFWAETVMVIRKLDSAYLHRRQLADELNVGLRTVDSWIHRGICGVKLGVVYVGGVTRIRRADYRAFQALVNRRRGVEGPTVDGKPNPAADDVGGQPEEGTCHGRDERPNGGGGRDERGEGPGGPGPSPAQTGTAPSNGGSRPGSPRSSRSTSRS